MTKYAELKKLAEGATPGIWVADRRSVTSRTKSGLEFCIPNSDDDAKYIAKANPQTILELIAENEKLVDAVRKMSSYKSSDYAHRSFMDDMSEIRNLGYKVLKEVQNDL